QLAIAKLEFFGDSRIPPPLSHFVMNHELVHGADSGFRCVAGRYRSTLRESHRRRKKHSQQNQLTGLHSKPPCHFLKNLYEISLIQAENRSSDQRAALRAQETPGHRSALHVPQKSGAPGLGRKTAPNSSTYVWPSFPRRSEQLRTEQGPERQLEQIRRSGT